MFRLLHKTKTLAGFGPAKVKIWTISRTVTLRSNLKTSSDQARTQILGSVPPQSTPGSQTEHSCHQQPDCAWLGYGRGSHGKLCRAGGGKGTTVRSAKDGKRVEAVCSHRSPRSNQHIEERKWTAACPRREGKWRIVQKGIVIHGQERRGGRGTVTIEKNGAAGQVREPSIKGNYCPGSTRLADLGKRDAN